MTISDESYSGSPRPLPNSRLILLLGILSVLLCWWHFISFTGLITGFITLVMANRETKLFHSNPGAYTTSSLNNVKTGRMCALIGMAVSAIIFTLVMLMIFGILATLPFWGMIH